MTQAHITHPDGTTEAYATSCPLDVYVSTLDPFSPEYWENEDTGEWPAFVEYMPSPAAIVRVNFDHGARAGMGF